MARSMFDALLKQPERMGARTQSRNTLGINHPLAESSPVARIPLSMIPFVGGGVSGYTQEDLATLQLPKETTLFSPLGYDITDKDLAKFGLATDAMDWIPGAAVVGGMATGAGLLGRALKGADYAPTSTDDISAALLGQSLQRQGALDEAMVTHHGSPHKFDALDPTKIGTGEGAQAYGHGLYVAENPKVAGQYKADRSGVGRYMADGTTTDHPPVKIAQDAIDIAGSKETAINDLERVLKANSHSKNPAQKIADKEVEDAIAMIRNGEVVPSGNLYEIDVPDEDIAKMLDWDAPLSEQPESVREALGKIGVGDAKTGGEAYQQIAMKEATDRNWPTEGAKKYATEALQNLGIPGIKYYDGGSRSAGEGTRNMVLFDELARRAKVLKRNDEVIAEPSVDEFIGRLLNK
jgi:hypothetical protein